MENKQNTENKKPDSPMVSDEEVKQELKEKIKKEKFRPYWTWYIFLICNVLVILGAAITWIVWTNNAESKYWVSTIVCNLVAIGGIAAFAIFEVKDLKLKLFHTQKKWSYFIIGSVCVFGAIIVISSVLGVLQPQHKGSGGVPIEIVCDFSVTAFLSLVAVGLYRYGRFHIDKDIFARKHGVIVKEQLEAEKSHEIERSKVDAMSKAEFDKLKEKIDMTPDHEKLGRAETSGMSHEKFDEDK